jgi:hypothetical protein
LKAFNEKPGQDMKDAIAADAGTAELHKILTEIVGTYFIARDYESVDAWGKKLNRMDCRLNCNYIPVTFKPVYHAVLSRREQRPLPHT